MQNLADTMNNIAVVIPCYKVKRQILSVLSAIGPQVTTVYVVDDKCPEQTGAYVQKNCPDPRVRVIFHETNMGVGGATISGYRRALIDGATIVVKIDGDGQMDPAIMGRIVSPILSGNADYTKGNRFFNIESLRGMPRVRILGNSLLSLINKISSGYWEIMDPTNGYTAIHAAVLKLLPLHKIDNGFFFEGDMLFRLNTVRAVVRDVPIDAKYTDEVSNLRLTRIVLEFPGKYTSRFIKRVFYNYFLRDFNAGSMQLLTAVLLLAFGTAYGSWKWYLSYTSGIPATSGTIMIAALPILIGFQLLISAINYDISSFPKVCIQQYYKDLDK
jgi:glycosyltransferase involved in cell wall biosynthesis